MSSEKDILELEDQRFSAMVAEDFRSLDALVHDELVYIAGQPRSLRLLFLNAWAKTAQGWRFVAWQSTPRAA